jgi:two-component system KDP operon response regulator KdpE
VSSVPVLMLTVRAEESDRIRGLEIGADDYMTKPYSPRELVTRIKALLRRSFTPSQARKTRIVVDDDLTIDFGKHEVLVRGRKVTLRPTEYRLLYHLVNNAGRLMTHETLLSKVWGPEYRDEGHYLRLYITYLRQKLERDPAHPRYILTERGVGYRFRELESEEEPEVTASAPAEPAEADPPAKPSTSRRPRR